MYKFLKIILTGVLLSASFFLNGESLGERKIIIVTKGEGLEAPPAVPNSLSPVPISCSVDDELMILYAGFLDDLGDVTISVEEVATGFVSSTVVDSALGTAQMLLSGNPGLYTVTFLTEGGDVYTGNFIL